MTKPLQKYVSGSGSMQPNDEIKRVPLSLHHQCLSMIDFIKKLQLFGINFKKHEKSDVKQLQTKTVSNPFQE